ncbi:MAG: hypothetical protein F6K36_02605 [Symploca sp. SIO3C6]|nr:hypothetical protein [Symploca sp. SIO3C6]
MVFWNRFKSVEIKQGKKIVINKTFHISGSVIGQTTRQGVTGLRVEAWDKDLIIDDLLGSAITKSDGTFQLSFDESYFREVCLDRQPDLYFKIYNQEELIKSTEDSVLWNVKEQDSKVLIEMETAPPVSSPVTVPFFGNVHDTIKTSSILREKAVDAYPASQIFAEYMANIIKHIPDPGTLTMLTGTANSQASFFFQSSTTNEINANLYNNILSPRVKGGDSPFGVNQAELLSAAFTNAYLQVYLSLRYQLSQADQATEQELVAKVANNIKTLRPLWNEWVNVFGSEQKVPKLNMSNTDTALLEMTGTLQVTWVNPDFKQKLVDDPSYPYTHMNDFDQIFSLIPATVPLQMRTQIKAVYNAQGAQGAITAKRSNATQILSGVRQNIQQPRTENGGLKLTGSDRMIPGLTFQPANPTTIVDQLRTNPPTETLSYTGSITKSDNTTLSFNASVSGGISIPILDFFSLTPSGGATTSIFQNDFAGSKFSVEVVVNNPTLQPKMTVAPLLYNISTAQGWLYADPVKEAVNNGSNTDVTGFVFDGGLPDFDFSEGGDFGYVNTLVLSQFLELKLVFEQCRSKEVRKYFEQHTKATISFLGIPLGRASQSSSYSYDYSAETETSITVTLKPNPPGYVPGGSDITESLCNLVAVGVIYPFA